MNKNKKNFRVMCYRTIILLCVGQCAVTLNCQARTDTIPAKKVMEAVRDTTDYATRDSLGDRTRTLDELIVKGSSVLRKGNTIELYPTRRDKRFAAGAVDVLANMNLPEVEVNPMDGRVTSTDGETVSMFIDFQPASPQQLRDVRPQDISRIDIIRSPSDPRFQGARVVANYIMKRYEYGGYTKLGATQYLPPYSGTYDLYSKFSCHRMTLDVSTGLNYIRLGDRSGSKECSSYRFDTGEVERLYRTTGHRSRQITPRVSARAVYSAPGISIANTAAFNYSRLRPSVTEAAVDFSAMYDPGESSRSVSRHERSALWDGGYYFRLSHGWSMNLNTGFNWAENSDRSSYLPAQGEPIVNDISESILSTYGSLSFSRKAGVHDLSLSGAGGWSRNTMEYTSDATTDVYHREGYGQARVQLGLNFNGFSILPSVTMSLSSEKVNRTETTRLLPKSFIPFYVRLSGAASLNGSFEFAIGAPSTDQMSPVLIRTNEIDAVRGNDRLGNYRFYNARLGYSHNWGPWLRSRIDALFNCQDNVLAPVYSPLYTSDPGPLMVRDVVNRGHVCTTSLSASLSGSYLQGRLALSLSGSLGLYSERSVSHRDRWSPDCRASASYYLGNFRINAYFTPSSWRYSQWYDTRTPAFWYLGASYSVGDLFVDLRFSNPSAGSYERRRTRIRTADYALSSVSYAPNYHRCIRLSLTYSFGYGRKLDRRDEVGSMDGPQSAILK